MQSVATTFLVLVLITVSLGYAVKYQLLPEVIAASLPEPLTDTIALLPPLPTLPTPAISQGDQVLGISTNESTNQISETVQNVREVWQQVVRPSEPDTEQTLPERAAEYGQYLYCKGVVTNWEESKSNQQSGSKQY